MDVIHFYIQYFLKLIGSNWPQLLVEYTKSCLTSTYWILPVLNFSLIILQLTSISAFYRLPVNLSFCLIKMIGGLRSSMVLLFLYHYYIYVSVLFKRCGSIWLIWYMQNRRMKSIKKKTKRRNSNRHIYHRYNIFIQYLKKPVGNGIDTINWVYHYLYRIWL
jgi:hypothetical protein